MKLDKNEIVFLKRNEQIIIKILEKRISDLKDQLLEVPDEKRDTVINFIKEYKLGLGIIKEMCTDKTSEDFTGI
jgi:hypothetical protein